jgi:hypothetical protein
MLLKIILMNYLKKINTETMAENKPDEIKKNADLLF